MFKRANKITALLVAAASVMSVVPAMAADTTRLGNKEGTIKQGIAFGDGSYSYYGYRNDDADTGIYYNNDGGKTDKFNDDLADYRFNNDSKYGTKYAYAQENSNDDEYLVDLSTGKVVDDETAEEKADNAKSKLVSKIKKADRYKDIITNSSDLVTVFDSGFTNPGANTFDQILKGQFGEVWYEYKVTTTGAATLSYVDETGAAVTSKQTYFGFSNESGNYVDLSQETNIRVFSTLTGRAEYIKQYGEENKDAGLTVNLLDVKPLAQDADYIYALTKVQVIDSNAVNLTAAQQQAQVQFFVQKISKAQGGKDDENAYTAKSVDSYQLQAPNATGSNNAIYSEGDFTAAYEKLVQENITNERLLGIVVKDSTLYVYTAKTNNFGTASEESDKLQVWKLKLGKFKKTANVGSTLTKDVDTNAVKKDGDTDDGDVIDFKLATPAEDEGLQGLEAVTDRKTTLPITVAGRPLYRLPSVSLDTAGNVWAVEKGKVLKISGTDKTTVYTVDRAMNAIDAYDEKNILVWDVSGDVYTNISEGKKTTVDDAVAVDPTIGKPVAATVGWKQETTGWTFYDVNGTKTASKWVIDNGTWYYIKADGIMATGWQQVAGTWYYLNASGAMATGWINDGGTWYYLAGSGAMLANTTVDGYVLGASGAWVK